MMSFISSHLSRVTFFVVGAIRYNQTFPPFLSSAALRESANPISIHYLMLSSHLFFCLPLLLAPFSVSHNIAFDIPEDLEMWSFHLNVHFFISVRRWSCIPVASWILLLASSEVSDSI